MKFARLKSVIRNEFIKQMKAAEENKEFRPWATLFAVKLLYSLVFFSCVEMIYVWWADTTLNVLMTPQPLVRSEQFTLSLLIHYPQYLLWGIMGGLFTLLVCHGCLCLLDRLMTALFRRMVRDDSTAASEKKEVTHD